MKTTRLGAKWGDMGFITKYVMIRNFTDVIYNY